MPLTAQDLQTAVLQGAKSEQEAALKRYLQTQEPAIAGQKQQAVNASNLETLNNPTFQAQVNDGGSAQVGDLHVGGNPYAKMAGRDQAGDEAARKSASGDYSKAITKLQDAFKASTEGMDLINDPHNPGALGQARTLMLKVMGMNRYNEKEAEAVLPPALRGTVSQLFNAAGDQMSPLNESQRGAVNQFFQTQLHNVKSQHDQLKQNVLGRYNTSRYATSMGQQALGGLGSPFDKGLADAETRYQQTPRTQGPNLTSTPSPGPIDRLASFLGLGAKPQAAAPAQAQTMRVKHLKSGQTGTIPANEFDPAQYEQVQ